MAASPHGSIGAPITRGSLISFAYPRSMAMSQNAIHDPYPMVILTDVWPNHIRGVNLHYLTFPYIKKLLQNYGGNPGFSYSFIKPDAYMANAFRMYVRGGVRNPKRLDTEWLLTVLGSVRSFSPGEIEKIRQSIQQQIQSRLQAKADELTSYEEWRSSLSRPQQVQLNNTIGNVQQALTGGLDRGLVQPTGPSPQQAQTQLRPSNTNVPEVGPEQTP